MAGTGARVVLAFENSTFEVPAALQSRRGALQICAREAEEKFGVLPQSYGFFDAEGKIDSLQSFERAMSRARDGTCTLEVREDPVGKKMRLAMGALEKRILAKVEVSLAGLRQEVEQTVTKVSDEITPMMEKLAMDRVDMQRTVDELSLEAFESRSDLVLRIDEISREALEARIDSLEQIAELETKLSGLAKESVVAMKNLETLENELENELMECAAMEFDLAQRDNVEKIQAEIAALGNTQVVASSRIQPRSSDRQMCASAQVDLSRASETLDRASVVKGHRQAACDLDLGERQHGNASNDEKKTDAFIEWSKRSLVDVSFDLKGPSGASRSFKLDKKSSALVQGSVYRPRPSGRMSSCHSMPLLTPL